MLWALEDVRRACVVQRLYYQIARARIKCLTRTYNRGVIFSSDKG